MTTDQPAQPIEAAAAAAAASSPPSGWSGPWPPPPLPQRTPQLVAEAGPPPEYRQSAHELLAAHHGVHGALDLLERRLSDLLGFHAAVISDIAQHAPPVAPGFGEPVGVMPFWERVMNGLQAHQGALRLAEQDAEKLLVQHAGVIASAEQFL